MRGNVGVRTDGLELQRWSVCIGYPFVVDNGENSEGGKEAMDWGRVATDLNQHVHASPHQIVILSHGLVKHEEVLQTRFRRLCNLNYLEFDETIIVATYADGRPDPNRVVGTATGVRNFARLMRDELGLWITDSHRLHQLSTRGCHLELTFDDGQQILTASMPKHHQRSCLEILGFCVSSRTKPLREPTLATVSRAMTALAITAATIVSNSMR